MLEEGAQVAHARGRGGQLEGFLVQASNVDQLTELLEGLIAGRIDTREIVARAIEKVGSAFDVERNTKELGELFRSLPGAGS